MAYKCRDCETIIKVAPNKPTNKCYHCGSIYLLPQRNAIKIKKKEFEVTLSDRFLSLFFGSLVGLITFFIWGIMLIAYGGPSTGKGTLIMFYSGAQFSIYFAIALGIIGFAIGSDRLINLFGIMWGTDKEFNQRFDNRILDLLDRIPIWVIYLFLSIIIVGSYSIIYIIMKNTSI